MSFNKNLSYLYKKLKSAQIRFFSWTVKMFYKITHSHPSSFPYISGDSFRAICKHVWDVEQKKPSFTKKNIQKGDLVYIAGNHLKDFFSFIQNNTLPPFILISGNDDINITAEFADAIPVCIYHWFAQNCCIKHKKITPIPIGLENRRFHWHGNIKDFNRLRKETPYTPNTFILYGFSVGNNKEEREVALSVLQNLSWAYPTGNLNSWYYRRYLRQFGLVASPPGNGEDCHRTWEALYLGVSPVVKRSVLTEYFYFLGLPLVLINKWDELYSWEESQRLQAAQRARENINHPVLFMPFWINLIYQKRKELLENL